MSIEDEARSDKIDEIREIVQAFVTEQRPEERLVFNRVWSTGVERVEPRDIEGGGLGSMRFDDGGQALPPSSKCGGASSIFHNR